MGYNNNNKKVEKWKRDNKVKHNLSKGITVNYQ
jgi:hypothetical protein